jgi:nucleoside-diphosphate-sugar epimerase
VTGAAGFIGCHLVEALDARGWTVAGIDNERSGDWSRVPSPCERVPRDLVDLSVDDLADLSAGADVVFHLAAEKYNSPDSSPERIIDVNIAATQRLCEGAARAGAGKVLFTSSLYAYGSLGPGAMKESDVPTPTTMYGMSKLAGEGCLRVAERDHGLAWTVARLFFIYGPRQYAEGGYKSVIVSNFERLLLGERPTIYGDGRQALDYIYVDDAVDALLRMASHEQDGKVLNVASGRALSVNQLTELMLTVAGRDLEPQMCPPDWTAGSVRVGEPTLVTRETGWRATTSAEVGLEKVWRWMTSVRA